MTKLRHGFTTSALSRFSFRVVISMALLGSICVERSFGVSFNLINGPGLVTLLGGSPAQQALANNVINGFQTSGNFWSASYNDPITINLQIDFASLGAGILGSASTATQSATYSSVRTALIGDASTASDASAVAGLPAGPALSFYTNNRAGSVIFDNDGSANNTVIDLPQANAKALGLRAANDPAIDGSITFSSNFNFDFAHGPTIGAGLFDFVGVATHEIGHALGFFSGVDTVDFFSGAGGGAAQDLNGGSLGIGTLDPFRVFTVLDLYRHSATSQTVSATTLDLATGDTPYFSLNGATNLGTFSTGVSNGDGRQASHWKDNLGLGIMDPTLAPGEKGDLKALDYLAVDVIGYNLVPEPGSILLAAMSFVGFVGFCARRKRIKAA